LEGPARTNMKVKAYKKYGGDFDISFC
jgi:hypothetical protein